LEIIYWLIPIAILLLAIAIAAFVWAVKSDQYGDLESPAYKILFDDDSNGDDAIKTSDDGKNQHSQNNKTRSNP
jgi:cbb3-type cytochrome oxidase maturation protein